MSTPIHPTLHMRDLVDAIVGGSSANPVDLTRNGQNPAAGTAQRIIGTANTGVADPLPDVAATLKIKSADNANDKPGGQGALTVLISGLNANWVPITETVALNGTTLVPTTKAFLRVLDVSVASTGTLLGNQGAITVYQNNGTSVMTIVPAYVNKTQDAAWSVPAGRTLYITEAWFYHSNPTASVVFLPAVYIHDITTGLWLVNYQTSTLLSEHRISWSVPFMVPEKKDIQLLTKLSDAGPAVVSAGFAGWYE